MFHYKTPAFIFYDYCLLKGGQGINTCTRIQIRFSFDFSTEFRMVVSRLKWSENSDSYEFIDDGYFCNFITHFLK